MEEFRLRSCAYLTINKSVEILTVPYVNDDDIYQTAYNLLCQNEKARASNIVVERERRKFVYWRACLRSLLGERLELPPTQVALKYGEAGKPRLSEEHGDSRLRFNLAHSSDLAVFAITVDGEVGVDLEYSRTIPDQSDIARETFSPPELACFRILSAAGRRDAFLLCWTRMEACAKATGNGLKSLYDGPSSIGASNSVMNGPIEYQPFSSLHNSFEITTFAPGSDFIASCALIRDAH